MNLEITNLEFKASHKGPQILSFCLHEMSGVGNSIDTECRLVGFWGWGGWGAGAGVWGRAKRCGVSFQEMKTFWTSKIVMDCTPLQIY